MDMVKVGFILGYLIFLPVFIFAQQSNVKLELEEWTHVMLRDKNLDHRQKAYNQIDSILYSNLIENKEWDFLEEDIEGLSIVRSKDDKLRIVSFQLYVDVNDYRFGGYVVDFKHKKPYKLSDISGQLSDEDAEYHIGNQDQWYGVVYLNIHEIDKNQYVLVGYDQYSLYSRRKVVDFIKIDKDGITFGEPMFGEKDESVRNRKMRFLYTYAAQTSAMLKFCPDAKHIIFEHLQPVKSDLPEQGLMMVPDGTHSGYILTKEGLFDYEDSMIYSEE